MDNKGFIDFLKKNKKWAVAICFGILFFELAIAVFCARNNA